MMKRNDQTVSARQRLHMNRKKDEKRQLNGHAIVVHKKMLRKIRAQAVEARAQAEREGRDASAPKPLVALEVGRQLALAVRGLGVVSGRPRGARGAASMVFINHRASATKRRAALCARARRRRCH